MRLLRSLALALLCVARLGHAQSVTTSTPVVTQQTDGSQLVQYSTTVLVPAQKAATPPPVTPPPTTPPVTTPPATPPPASKGSPAVGINATMGGAVLVPVPEIYQDISQLPVDATRDAYFKAEYTKPSPDFVHLDATMTTVNVDSRVTGFTTFSKVTYADQSDGAKIPVFPAAAIEAGSDRHVLVFDIATGLLYEAFNVQKDGKGGYKCDALAVWNGFATTRRALGKTSADAAGLPIRPLLLRYEEIAAGPLTHATRFTTNNSNSQFFCPATHSAGGGDEAFPGMVLRLKANVDLTKFSPLVQNILKGWRTYGLYWADNGSNMFTQADSDPRWFTTYTFQGQQTTVTQELSVLTENNFEEVDTGRVPQSPPAAINNAVTCPN